MSTSKTIADLLREYRAEKSILDIVNGEYTRSKTYKMELNHKPKAKTEIADRPETWGQFS